MKKCLFCDIIHNKNNERSALDNAVLYEDSNFLIKPALGALTEGYLVMMPKRHVFSMAELSDAEIREYFSLEGETKDIISREYGIDPIVLEHGSGNGKGKFDGSIVHAHSHVVPINFAPQEHENFIEEYAMQEFNLSKLQRFSGLPYYLYTDQTNTSNISEIKGDAHQSQNLRLKIAKHLGIAEKYDWRKHAFAKNMARTFVALKEPFSKL